MQTDMSRDELGKALDAVMGHREDAGDGQWLETLTRDVAPHLTEWQIEQAWKWADWPDRAKTMGKRSRSADDGVDIVAKGRDGRLIAIQCKARGRTNEGREGAVTGSEVDKFAAATTRRVWAERWIVSNVRPSENVRQKLGPLGDPEAPIRWVMISEAIGAEMDNRNAAKGWEKDPRTAMQDEAIEKTVAGLEALRKAKARHPAWEPDESRGRTIMPCGTGKTRVGYEVSRRIAGGGGELSPWSWRRASG